MDKNRLEAFSDGVFAIILTILVLELRVPEIHGSSLTDFIHGLQPLFPKLLSFSLSFFLIAVFWVNHHYLLTKLKKVDDKLVWLNVIFLFFTSLFPFIAAFIGDYPANPFVIALYPLNMLLTGLAFQSLWRYGFVDSNLSITKLTDSEKKKELRTFNITSAINVGLIFLSFVSVPATLFVIIIMPIMFIAPNLRTKRRIQYK